MQVPDADSGRSPDHPQWFVTTRWSVVLAAGQRNASGSVEALEFLCRRYWPPIYAFIQRRGFTPADAQDLTQEFFARLLEKNSIGAADASKGKFRTFLLTALTRFLVNERERGQAQKRGGGCVHLSLDFEAEDRHGFELAAVATPETIYERRWVEALLETVLSQLREEYESAGDRERFDILKVFLVAEQQATFVAEGQSNISGVSTLVSTPRHECHRDELKRPFYVPSLWLPPLASDSRR